MSITEASPLIAEQATAVVNNDRFLNTRDPATSDPFLHALGFYCANQDVLLSSSGLVMQAGMYEPDSEQRATSRTSLSALASFVTSHELINLNAKDAHWTNTASLVFDATRAEDNIFAWEANIASSGEGRQSLQLHIIRNGMVAYRRTRDGQGGVVSTTEVAAEPVLRIVDTLTRSNLIDEARAKLHVRQRGGQHGLTAMMITHSKARKNLRHSPLPAVEQAETKMKKQEAEFEKHLDKIGFSPARIETMVDEYHMWWLGQLACPLRIDN